jgi:hypothetical protein
MANEFRVFASLEELQDGRTVRQQALVGVYDSHAGAVRGIATYLASLAAPAGGLRFLKGFEIEGDCWDVQESAN